MNKAYFLAGLYACLCVVLIGGCSLPIAKQEEPSGLTVAQAQNTTPGQKEWGIIAKIKVTFDGGEAFAEIYDNPTGRDFAAMLPLTLRFKDYNKTEKIADLPRAVSIENAPEGFQPSVGDLTLFAPWGNLAIFYQDFRYSEGLIPIGHFTSGVKGMAKVEQDFTVHMERIQ